MQLEQRGHWPLWPQGHPFLLAPELVPEWNGMGMGLLRPPSSQWQGLPVVVKSPFPLLQCPSKPGLSAWASLAAAVENRGPVECLSLCLLCSVGFCLQGL